MTVATCDHTVYKLPLKVCDFRKGQFIQKLTICNVLHYTLNKPQGGEVPRDPQMDNSIHMAIYSGTPRIRTPEMWPPLHSGHFEKSQSMLFNTNSPLKCGHPSNKDTFTGVAGLEGFHCTGPCRDEVPGIMAAFWDPSECIARGSYACVHQSLNTSAK